MPRLQKKGVKKGTISILFGKIKQGLIDKDGNKVRLPRFCRYPVMEKKSGDQNGKRVMAERRTAFQSSQQPGYDQNQAGNGR